MKIDSVDLFYLKMPEVLDIGDGSQDALLVRVRSGNFEGWGEAEASPLTSIASWITPMSHSACHPVIDSVLGERIDSPEDIERITLKVRTSSFYGIIQANLTLSGVEIALWDLLGQVKEQPIYQLLGYKTAEKKLPYASVLFGDTPEETLNKAIAMRAKGFSAMKFGWGPFGQGSVDIDTAHVHAAREGLGKDGHLLIDAGTVFNEDLDAAAARLPMLKSANVMWFEEPFAAAAISAYGKLAKIDPSVKIAGGEGANNPLDAQTLIDHGGVGFIQIDTGYIGGIGSAYRVAQYATSRGVQFVNHTFTSHSALASSLHPYAGLKDSWITEYPMEPKQLCLDMTVDKIDMDKDGMICLPDSPGLGVTMNVAGIAKYVMDVEIKVQGKVLYSTPTL